MSCASIQRGLDYREQNMKLSSCLFSSLSDLSQQRHGLFDDDFEERETARGKGSVDRGFREQYHAICPHAFR